MPSIKALEEFKSSFNNLGGEPQTMGELNLPADDLALPDHEADAAPDLSDIVSPIDESPGDAAPTTDGAAQAGEEGPEKDLDFGDLGDLIGGMNTQVPDLSGTTATAAGASSAPGPDTAGLGDLLDTIPDDFGSADNTGGTAEELPDLDAGPDAGLPEDIPQDLDVSPEEPAAGAAPDESAPDDFDIPPDLLDGFADEIEAENKPEAQSSPGGGPDSTDQEELPEFDSGDSPELPAGESAAPDLPDGGLEELPDFDSGDSLELPAGETAAPDLSDGGLEDLPDFDSGDSLELPTGEDAAPDLSDGGLEDLPDFDSGESLELPTGETAAPDLSDGGLEDLPDFDSGDSLELPGEEIAGADLGDAADTLELSDDDGLDLGGETPGAESEGSEAFPEDSSADSQNDTQAGDISLDDNSGDDFSLPGMDSVFDGKSLSTGDALDDADEIRLTDEELEMFQKTISSYPLNLRIACEELIAEQAVAPDLMSQLVNLLVIGAPAKETAALAGKIMGRTIQIPRGFEVKTGEALEAEQASFAYIFFHNFLPVLRLFMMIALVLFSAGYLCWRFIYLPIKAEKIYKLGIERIEAGEYGRANERFNEAFRIHEKKSWIYTYARAFREARQYALAEEKYRELLYYTASKNKRRIPEKAAVLEYADLAANSIGDFEAADSIIRRNILDYYPWDRDGLLALGDNSLAWGEYDPSRLDDARESYARLMERYGRSDPLLERMLLYFIRTDNLGEVLPLQAYFMSSTKKKISSTTLAELGGYLLDKRYEKVRGVPNEYLDSIVGIRDVIFRAIRQDPMLPESYYHLARYYYYYDNFNDEKITLELAIKVFEAAKEENSRRIKFHILTLRRYSEVLIGGKEFFPAEEHLNKAVVLYLDGLSRRLLTVSPEFGRLYADLGDLEYFVKDGDLQTALDYYSLGERNGWAPPEIQYRMGAVHYQLRQWGPAQDRIFAAYREITPNRRILFALGNVSYMRGNYYAAQGYYDRLLDILEDDRSRLSPITPTNDDIQLDLAERLMVAQNNLGVTLEAITERTGNSRYRSRAQGLYSDSERAWDVLTRNPENWFRMRPSPDINAPGINPAYLNVQNSLHPVSDFEPQFFIRIDKDILEPSAWEELAPSGYRLSEGIFHR